MIGAFLPQAPDATHPLLTSLPVLKMRVQATLQKIHERTMCGVGAGIVKKEDVWPTSLAQGLCRPGHQTQQIYVPQMFHLVLPTFPYCFKVFGPMRL